MPANHPNVELFGRIYAAFTSGDMKALGEYFSDEVVWHTPGSHQLAGAYSGKAATFGSFAREFELSQGTYAVDIHDVLANDDHIVALLHARARRKSRLLDQKYALVFRIRHAQIVEAWELWSDQAAVDSFWA